MFQMNPPFKSPFNLPLKAPHPLRSIACCCFSHHLSDSRILLEEPLKEPPPLVGTGPLLPSFDRQQLERPADVCLQMLWLRKLLTWRLCQEGKPLFPSWNQRRLGWFSRSRRSSDRDQTRAVLVVLTQLRALVQEAAVLSAGRDYGMDRWTEMVLLI